MLSRSEHDNRRGLATSSIRGPAASTRAAPRQGTDKLPFQQRGASTSDEGMLWAYQTSPLHGRGQADCSEVLSSVEKLPAPRLGHAAMSRTSVTLSVTVKPFSSARCHSQVALLPLASMVRMAWPKDPSLRTHQCPDVCARVDARQTWQDMSSPRSGNHFNAPLGSMGRLPVCGVPAMGEATRELRAQQQDEEAVHVKQAGRRAGFGCHQSHWYHTYRRTRSAGKCSSTGPRTARRNRASRWWSCSSRRRPSGRGSGSPAAGSGTTQRNLGPPARHSRCSSRAQRSH